LSAFELQTERLGPTVREGEADVEVVDRGWSTSNCINSTGIMSPVMRSKVLAFCAAWLLLG